MRVPVITVICLAFLLSSCTPLSATPEPTPDIDATVEARLEATLTAIPMPTPIPAVTPIPIVTPIPMSPTATPLPTTISLPTATSLPTPNSDLRPRDEWTVENPATREEIEAELGKHRGRRLTFSSWGGPYQVAQRQSYAEPLAEQFGIEIADEGYPDDERLRAMKESGNITWHVFDTGSGRIHALGQGGYLEDLDFSVIDNRDFFDALKAPYIGGGGITWSETWAYNTDVYPKGSQPQNMADIYDTEKFPGLRTWSSYWPGAEIVFVLLSENPGLLDTAEGRASLAAPDEAQVDRAFELFDEYRDQPSLFWTTGSDCPQFLLSGEADMCTNWNSRIYDAAKEGAPLRICWECGHVLNTVGWGIIKGLKEQAPETFELAQLFMAWTSFPEVNARMSQFIAYGPVNTKALETLADPTYDDVRDELPSSSTNIPYAIINNEVHRAANLDAWRERYEAFKQTVQ